MPSKQLESESVKSEIGGVESKNVSNLYLHLVTGNSHQMK